MEFGKATDTSAPTFRGTLQSNPIPEREMLMTSEAIAGPCAESSSNIVQRSLTFALCSLWFGSEDRSVITAAKPSPSRLQ